MTSSDGLHMHQWELSHAAGRGTYWHNQCSQSLLLPSKGNVPVLCDPPALPLGLYYRVIISIHHMCTEEIAHGSTGILVHSSKT